MLQDKLADICLILRSKPLCFAVARIFDDFVTRTECARKRIRRIFDHVSPRYPANRQALALLDGDCHGLLSSLRW